MDGAPVRTSLWAKLRYEDDDRSTGKIVAWHPLLGHSADVAAVVEALLSRTILRERLARLAGWDKLTDVHAARLCVLAALHDVGKVNHGFQNRAFGLWPQAGHVGPMVDILHSDDPLKWLDPLGVREMVSWFSGGQDALYDFLLATWGHHGRPARPAQTPPPGYWDATEDRDPITDLERIASAARSWFPLAFGDAARFPHEAPYSFQHAFNGVLTLADWLGSDTRFFDFAQADTDYIDAARAAAARVVDRLVLDPAPVREAMEPASFDAILPDGYEPYGIQQSALDLDLHPEGSLTILESDTGSGKTEAAIARFLRLYRAGLVDGMYFALPTRTSAKQIYDRVSRAIAKVFGEGQTRPPVVQAVPGYIKADAVEGVPLPNFDVRWPETDGDRMRERGWAAEHPKRYLAGAIVIGTIDQALLSTLEVGHAHMRGAALLRHLLVVDEVHASDVYMAALLDRVLDHHLEAGGHAFLMSATLGSEARIKLSTGGRGSTPAAEEAEEERYPLLTHVDATRTEPQTKHASSSGEQKEVEAQIEPIADDPVGVARRALQAAKEGARVLVIRNLVRDCVETQRALEELAGAESDLLFRVGGVPAPHHSRFAPGDRRLLDTQIEEAFGKGAASRGLVAVATSTVEISLDIDADLLLSDLCPMDVLLQRIGRLHRHRRSHRPEGFKRARCVVLVPGERDLERLIQDDGSSRGTHGLGGKVYADLRMIEATWRVIASDDPEVWSIPQHNRLLVERATHPEYLRAIVEEQGAMWHAHQRFIIGCRTADREISRLAMLDRSKRFSESAFADDEERNRTRLGADDYQVELPEPVMGPFGEMVSEMKVASWMVAKEPPSTNAEQVTECDDGFSFRFGGRRFSYDRTGLSGA